MLDLRGWFAVAWLTAISLFPASVQAQQTRNYFTELGYYEVGGWVPIGPSPEAVCADYANVWHWNVNGYSYTTEQINPGRWACQRFHNGVREPTYYTNVLGVCQRNAVPLVMGTGRNWSYPAWDETVVGDCYCVAPRQFDRSIEWCDIPASTPPVYRDESCAAGNPVQPGTGAKRHSESDYIGAGAHPLAVTRAYRSDRVTANSLADLEIGWIHSYQARLVLNPYGDNNPVVALRPDASIRRFTTASTSVPRTWQADSGTRDALIELRDANNVLSGWQYVVAEDDAVETYDVAGKLQGIKARNGWLTTLVYSTAATPSSIAPQPGLLISVRNNFGREVRFTYNAQSRIAELLPPGAVSGTGAGASTSPIRYVYDEAASLGTGVPAGGQLTSVIWQDGKVRRYHYEDSRHPNALTGITDEAGVRYATYTYDANRRIVSEQLAGGADRLDFAYAGSQTTLTDYSTGSATQRTYTFANQSGVLRPTAVSAPCPLCGNTQASSTYDSAGRLTKSIGHDGKPTFYKYDTKGAEIERATFPTTYAGATTRPALSAAETVTTTAWHGTFNLPTRIASSKRYQNFSYSSNGDITLSGDVETTDATGAQKFSSAQIDSTRKRTLWTYNTPSLPTTIRTTTGGDGSGNGATETGRWTLTYNATGDVIAETRKYTAANPPRADELTRYNTRTPDGLPLQIVLADGKTATLTYKPRRMIDEISIASASATTRTQFFHNAAARPTEVLLPDNSRVIFEYSTLGRLSAVGDTAGNRFQYTYAADGSIQQGQDIGDAAALDSRVLAAYDPLGWAISGSTAFSATASPQQAALTNAAVSAQDASASTASVADALALSTSKAKRTSCIAACVAVGTYAGSVGGRSVGAAIGGTAGGVLGSAVPGVGTVALGTAGAVAGGAGGARAGARAGALAGGAMAAAMCPDDDDECEERRRTDEDACVAIAGPRYGRRGVAVCMSSAMQRYSECLRFGVGGIRTLLSGVDTQL